MNEAKTAAVSSLSLTSQPYIAVAKDDEKIHKTESGDGIISVLKRTVTNIKDTQSNKADKDYETKHEEMLALGMEISNNDHDKENNELEIENSNANAIYIFLFESANFHIWFEHWCMLQEQGSKIINKFEPLIIAIIVATFLAVLTLIYSIATDKLAVISELTVASMFISVILILVVLYSLQFAWNFHTIESMQLKSIQTQRTALYNYIAIQSRQDTNDINKQHKLKHLSNICNFLAAVEEQIGIRSVSLKIMGVKMDEIVVRLFFSSVVSSIPALYELFM